MTCRMTRIACPVAASRTWNVAGGLLQATDPHPPGPAGSSAVVASCPGGACWPGRRVPPAPVRETTDEGEVRREWGRHRPTPGDKIICTATAAPMSCARHAPIGLHRSPDQADGASGVQPGLPVGARAPVPSCPRGHRGCVYMVARPRPPTGGHLLAGDSAGGTCR